MDEIDAIVRHAGRKFTKSPGLMTLSLFDLKILDHKPDLTKLLTE